MRARRQRSFRPSLDVLPGRIAPSGGVSTPAAAVTPTAAPSSYTGDYLFLNNPSPWTIATPTYAVTPP